MWVEQEHPRNSAGEFVEVYNSDYFVQKENRFAHENGTRSPIFGNRWDQKIAEAKRVYDSDAPRNSPKKEMTPEEKIASVHIEAGKDNILPELNEESLEKLGVKNNKPVLVKASTIERNLEKHDEVSMKDADIIVGRALYSKDNVVVPGKNENGNYFVFYAKTEFTDRHGKSKYGTVAVDVASAHNNFEVVHWHWVKEGNMKSIDKEFKK